MVELALPLLVILSFSSGAIVTGSSTTTSDCVFNKSGVEICYSWDEIDFFNESVEVSTSSGGNTIGKYFREDGSRIADEPNAPVTFEGDMMCSKPYDVLFEKCWSGFE